MACCQIRRADCDFRLVRDEIDVSGKRKATHPDRLLVLRLTCNSSIFFVTLESQALFRIIMGFALTKFGRAAFTLVEIMIVVAVIVVLAATTIPGILRTGKHRKSTEILNGLRLRGEKRCGEKTGCA